MSADQSSSQPPPEGDYAYDEAHDELGGQPHREQQQPSQYVVTESSDTDQDLSYDLAHDIPPQRRD